MGKEGKGRERKGKEGKGRERKGKEGLGKEDAGDQRAWRRGRPQGWLEMGGETKPLEISELGCADGCGREMGAENCVDGCGRRGRKGGWKWVGTRRRWRSVRRIARTAADGVGATDWLEMDGEKRPQVMSELGCADGCGRSMGEESCADGCGRRGCN